MVKAGAVRDGAEAHHGARLKWRNKTKPCENVYAAPDIVGRIAQEANIGRLIVSHIGPIGLAAAISDLKKFYTGPLIIALICSAHKCSEIRRCDLRRL